MNKKCIDCGACVSVCPVNAIDHIKKPYAKIADYVSNYPLAEITCNQVELVNRGIKVPCLLYLDVALLAYTKANVNFFQFMLDIVTLAVKERNCKFLATLKKIQQSLKALGVSTKLEMTTELRSNHNHQTVNAVSRRNLLKNFHFRISENGFAN
ncbi:4Fe-4S binding protein [Anaerobacillus sp. HL2]|nr:4Fe-4S binding protein [Anaerobacillus sp. HL2]